MTHTNQIESSVLAQNFYRNNSESELDIFELLEENDININAAAKEEYEEQLSWLGRNDVNFELIHLLEVDDEYFVIYLSDTVTDTITQFDDLNEALEYCKDFIEELYEQSHAGN